MKSQNKRLWTLAAIATTLLFSAPSFADPPTPDLQINLCEVETSALIQSSVKLGKVSMGAELSANGTWIMPTPALPQWLITQQIETQRRIVALEQELLRACMARAQANISGQVTTILVDTVTDAIQHQPNRRNSVGTPQRRPAPAVRP